MRLRARRSCSVYLAAIELRVSFAAAEELRTEIRCQVHARAHPGDLAACGLRLRRRLTDRGHRFAVSLSACS